MIKKLLRVNNITINLAHVTEFKKVRADDDNEFYELVMVHGNRVATKGINDIIEKYIDENLYLI